MHKALNGKGYVKGSEGVFITTAGEVYAYRDGELTPLTVTDNPKDYAALEGSWTSTNLTRHADLTANAKCGILET